MAIDISKTVGAPQGISKKSDKPFIINIGSKNSEEPSSSIIKTEHIAILQQTMNFIALFNQLTKEGYRLMAINEGKFYFQKLKM